MNLNFLVPYPRRLIDRQRTFPFPARVRIESATDCRAAGNVLRQDLRGLTSIRISASAGFAIRLRLRRGALRQEGYRLTLDERGARIVGADAAGVFYGVQTLMQLLVLGDRTALPALEIVDWPEYRLRGFMADMARAVYTPALLRRLIRILSRLKMNLLHLHLTDNEMNSLRFRRLPLGKENPAAISLAELRRIVQYARERHVTILPEIECWGHAKALLYHRPDLIGKMSPGGEGCNFGVGDETIEFLGEMFDELIPALERDCMVHIGFDEATWAPLPTLPKGRHHEFRPIRLVERIYDALMAAGRKHGRRVTMHLWADEGGRPLPKRLRHKVVLEPWRYWERHEERLRAKLMQYAGRKKPRFMMGTGMSPGHYGGHFGATRLWCQHGRGIQNVEGVTICMWEDNDVPGKLLGVYAGADYAWSPESPVPPEPVESDRFWERFYYETGLRMRTWQVKFRDGDDEEIRTDRGPYVYRGRYYWGKRAGQAVSPTVDWRGPGSQ